MTRLSWVMRGGGGKGEETGEGKEENQVQQPKTKGAKGAGSQNIWII